MSKKWNVKIDDKPYEIEYKNNLIINGEKHKLKQFKKRTKMFTTEFDVPIGSKTALLVVGNFNNTHLVIDGKDCATGEDYVPVKLPGWAYIFIVLHLINFLNGAIGALLAVLGCTLTTAVSCNPRMNIFVKILLNIAIVILSVIVVFSLAIAANSIVG